MSYDAVVSEITRAVETIAILVLLLGGGIASTTFFSDWRRSGFSTAYHEYRANLGRAMLLGLEILIVADIIGTVAIEPTLQNVLLLGLIVLIRTFLSMALEVEISGRLPWSRHPESSPHEVGPESGTAA